MDADDGGGKLPAADMNQDCGDDSSSDSPSDDSDRADKRTPPTLSAVYRESNLFSDHDSEPKDWWFGEDERDDWKLPKQERFNRMRERNRVLCRALRRTKALKP